MPVITAVIYSKDRQALSSVWKNTERYPSVDRDTAELIRLITDVNVEIDEKEETVNMCKAVEDMRAHDRQQGIEEGREKGRAEGRAENLLANIKQLMKSLNLSLEQAMDALAVPQDERFALMKKI